MDDRVWLIWIMLTIVIVGGGNIIKIRVSFICIPYITTDCCSCLQPSTSIISLSADIRTSNRKNKRCEVFYWMAKWVRVCFVSSQLDIQFVNLLLLSVYAKSWNHVHQINSLYYNFCQNIDLIFKCYVLQFHSSFYFLAVLLIFLLGNIFNILF